MTPPTRPLWRSPRLWPLLVTQGLGAVNDNMFKTAASVLLLQEVPRAAPALVVLAGAALVGPYIPFSATAGQLADRLDKARVIRWVKWAELALMLLAAAALMGRSPALQFLVLTGLGVQAAFFSPLKYGILPDHLRPEELLPGNGLVEAATFLAILAGIMAGGALAGLPGGERLVAAAGLLVAAAGVAAAHRVRPAPSRAPGLRVGWNLLGETLALLRTARANKAAWRPLLGLSWFWALGATVVAELPVLVARLGGGASVITALLLAFSLGVGLGAIGCTRLGPRVGWAAGGLALFGFGLSLLAWRAPALPNLGALLAQPAGWCLILDLLCLAASGGAYSVPLYARLQRAAPPGAQARLVAANNLVNALAIFAAAAIAAALAPLGPAWVLALFATGSAAVALASARMAGSAA